MPPFEVKNILYAPLDFIFLLPQFSLPSVIIVDNSLKSSVSLSYVAKYIAWFIGSWSLEIWVGGTFRCHF